VKRHRNVYDDTLEVLAIVLGHNLPQEAPKDFAKAIIDVDRF
jgi:hypothetical protein